MDNRLKKPFVGEDNGCALAVGDTLGIEPRADISGLYILRSGGDEGDLLGTVEIVVECCRTAVERIGELIEVLGDEVTGLVLAEVGVVEVPIEERLILLLQTAEKRLLNLLQKIEAHEDIGVVFKGDGFVEGDLTVEGAFVGETLSGEDIVILLVDVADMAPELQEALLKLCGVVIGEVAEELADDVLKKAVEDRDYKVTGIE